MEKDNLTLPYDVSTHVYVFFIEKYRAVRRLLQSVGLKEYEHFVDGTKMLVENTDDLLTDEVTILFSF